MKRTKIAIIDVLGLTYDDNTVENYPLGGSESAVIYISRELVKIGFDVTVFNNCNDSRAKPGDFNGVKYVEIQRARNPQKNTNDEELFLTGFDVVISSRSAFPFTSTTEFLEIRRNNPHKILWLHDTFVEGENLVEESLLNGTIDEVFTLSDFHTTYFSFCHHSPAKRRNPEVLKSKIFMTRNGVCRRLGEVDINEKDPNLFVYNASVTKGMVPLLEKVWPLLKKEIPEAKLCVIGGYYRFRDNASPDKQEEDLRTFQQNEYYKSIGVHFTDIITQKDIAAWMAKASFMLYPGAFPETFGISTLEALSYNTPLITTRFGALEETAIEKACYLLDYAITPNGLYPEISEQEQVNKFVQLAVYAHRNPYLTYQKRHYCNIIRDISGWDSIALQWKQHLYKVLGLYMSNEEFRSVSYINKRVHQVFNRRFSNPEEWEYPAGNTETEILIISPFFNAKDYIERCILSVASQNYDNYLHILIDDASTDDGHKIAQACIESLPQNIRHRFWLIRNKKNVGAVKNQVRMLQTLLKDRKHKRSIVMLLDGDDALVNNNTIFQYYDFLYEKDELQFTYGSMWSLADNIPLIAQPYPEETRKNKTYKEHKFPWVMPYTHLRTFDLRLFQGLEESLFKNKEGNWYRAGGDNSLFFSLIERARPEKIRAVTDIVCLYNDINPLNDYKINSSEQAKTVSEITGHAMKEPAPAPTPAPKTLSLTSLVRQPTRKTRIMVGIPLKTHIEPETYKSLWDLDLPANVELDFEYSYGYQIDQVRNLIASWITKRKYDYLFSVDSDIELPRDALVKLLSHNKDIISGVYLQRRIDAEVPEVFGTNGRGGVSNIPLSRLQPPGLYQVAACGFGCVLVKREVIDAIGYPQFSYFSALDHKDTISEDVVFCQNAVERGFTVWVDSSIVCRHWGKKPFYPKDSLTAVNSDVPAKETQSVEERLRELSNQDLLPIPHKEYLKQMKEGGAKPKIIFDLGACVLHWTKSAQKVWPDATIVAFEGMPEAEFLYREEKIPYYIGILSDGRKEVSFYNNPRDPGGNSYYKENPELSPGANEIFPESTKKTYPATTLDEVVEKYKFPQPDLIKIDCQGAELDIIRGAKNTLRGCRDLVLELQIQNYNMGAPMATEVISYLESIGFKLVVGLFSKNMADGDYHFENVNILGQELQKN